MLRLDPVEEPGFFKKMRATSVPIKETVIGCAPYDIVLIGAPFRTHRPDQS